MPPLQPVYHSSCQPPASGCSQLPSPQEGSAWGLATSAQLAAAGTAGRWGLQSLLTSPMLCSRGISCYVAVVTAGAAVASPHADEQGLAITAGALHTAAGTGDQRCSFHWAGVVTALLHALS